MTPLKTDFLISGSGFGGSLMALILARAGKSVALVDRSRHPRFAIGESSTPLADRTLAQMCIRFGLPELLPLCHWGTWKKSRPELLCGRKRGFTYFDQTSGSDLTQSDFGERRMLVSASEDDEHSDTHWLRADVDQFLFQLAQAAGATTFQQCRYQIAHSDAGWKIEGVSEEAAFEISAPFLIDATGSSTGVLGFLKIPELTATLKTNSRSLFAHFGHTKTCEELLRESAIPGDSFPYRCDDAAVHQVMQDGWMWQLRYDDNSLSAGFMIDERPSVHHETRRFESAAEEWDWRISRSAFLQRQFRDAEILRPESGLQSTRRIQRLASRAAGDNWAALTNTVGFIDPLHSTGIAHTLFAVSRLADILLASSSATVQNRRLQEYSRILVREIQCVDQFVEGCYEAIPSFPLWCQWGMLYFAAATSMEQQPDEGLEQVSFLRADDPEFRAILQTARTQLGTARHCDVSEKRDSVKRFSEWLKIALQPWNHVGLFDETCDNLYSATAAPSNAW